MAKRIIVTDPMPVLKEPTRPITVFNEELHNLVADMAETMYDAPGVGLAANQIAVPLQLVVIDITPKEEERELIVLVNPRIVEAEGEQCDEEGCLSVVDYTATVKRFEKVRVMAQDIDGAPMQFTAEGFFARVIQHELDHLNGKLFVDRLSSLKRTLYRKRRKKQLQKENA